MRKYIFAVILISALALTMSGYWLGKANFKRTDTSPKSEISLEYKSVISRGVSEEEQQQIEKFVETFENALKQRDAEKTLSFFSAPETKEEQSELDSIMGADLARVGVSNPTRLFTTQGRNFTVTAHYVRSMGAQGAQVRVIVEEMRIIASGGEFVGYIAKVARMALVLDKSATGYKIAQYYFDSADHSASKYDGLTSL